MKYFVIFMFLTQLCYSYKLGKANTPMDACILANMYIEYELRDVSDWRTVDYIVDQGKGLCRDYAILMMEILYQNGHTNSDYLSVDYYGYRHALVYCEGDIYDPTDGYKVGTNFTVYYKLSYTELQEYIKRYNK